FLLDLYPPTQSSSLSLHDALPISTTSGTILPAVPRAIVIFLLKDIWALAECRARVLRRSLPTLRQRRPNPLQVALGFREALFPCRQPGLSETSAIENSFTSRRVWSCCSA